MDDPATQARHLVARLSKPGDHNPDTFREDMGDLCVLVQDSDAAIAEFVQGPPGNAERSGLHWAVSVLTRAAEDPKAVCALPFPGLMVQVCRAEGGSWRCVVL